MTFQDLILKLSAFWASHGCLIQQPLDLEVGAGTSHPETLFRVLGPKPWSVAYVQPSRRPDDGRFGENPNRLFKHHQFQVILKPSPDEVQHLYLESLESVGINPRQHDIRFEEDNWESPTLGAWGIGWQVMLDALAARAPVEPLARYFEYWLLRLQGVYPESRGTLSDGAMEFLAASRSVAPHQVGTVRADGRVRRELENAHRALITMHLEKTLKSDRVLRDLRRDG